MTTTANGLRDYLQTLWTFKEQMTRRPDDFAYTGAEEYIMKHGKLYESAPLTKAEFSHLATIASGRKWRKKECFYNAQLLATWDHTGQLRYTEGYAIGHMIPVLHAWLTLDGKVIDMTWRKDEKTRKHELFGGKILGVIPDDHAYYGVEFDTHIITRRLNDRGMASPLLDDWEDGYEIFRKPLGVESFGTDKAVYGCEVVDGK